MAANLKEHNYNGIDATIIADSKNGKGERITSFVVTFPRMVLSEFNTHRVFSRNSASSRAIPFKTMLKRVNKNPFIPIAFQKEHKGMQGKEYLHGFKLKLAKGLWVGASKVAIASAKLLNMIPVTKQLCNRILEPFAWHTVIVTATEWENFFNLRYHEAAEIHIWDLAAKMKKARNASEPKLLFEGEYHIPFGGNIDNRKVEKAILDIDERCAHFTSEQWSNAVSEARIQIAIARCARVSYGNFEGQDDFKKDISLFNRLSGMGHWSPFEHVAKAMSNKTKKRWSRNFKGFTQYRAELDQ